MSAGAEWVYVRAGLFAVSTLLLLAVAGWRFHDSVHDEPTHFESMAKCLRNEKGATLAETRDPIARSAEQGSLRTVIETNGVTVAVAESDERASELVASYRSVAGDLGPRLEQRRSTVYLWDRDPSPTQRQTLFDCTY